MTETDTALLFIASNGQHLTHMGDQLDGWSVVSREYDRFKYTQVFFIVVAADPSGGLWRYRISESSDDGTEVVSDPTPVTAVVQTKRVVSFEHRLIRRPQENK